MPLTELVLGALTKSLTGSLVKASGAKLRASFADPAKEAALERCVQAGLLGLVHATKGCAEEERQHLIEVLGHFMAKEELAADLGLAWRDLLKGRRLDVNEVEELFIVAGFSAEGLCVGFETIVTAFEAAFVSAALEEEVLREPLKARVLLMQLETQQEHLAVSRELVEFLREAKPGTAKVEANEIKAQTVIGQQIVFGGLTIQVTADSGASTWEAHYLRTLIADCDFLDLSAIDETHPQGSGSGRAEVRLRDVYTPLKLAGVRRLPSRSVEEVLLLSEAKDILTPAEGRRGRNTDEEPVPVTALEAVAVLPRLVVLGRPGGGKSTLVNHLVTQLARRRATPGRGELPGWPEEASPLPVRVVLRRFAHWLPDSVPKRQVRAQVVDYLRHMLSESGCDDAFEGLRDELRAVGGLVLFDGLDEVAESDAVKKRSLIRACIETFARIYTHCRVLVTCREYAYTRDDAWRLPEAAFPVVSLAPFGPEEVKAFTTAWYQVVGPPKGWLAEKCEKEAAVLSQAAAEWPHLRSLAESPLLLTLMAQIHGRDGSLPRDRADLYERAVRLLLSTWERRLQRDLEEGATVADDRLPWLHVPTQKVLAALRPVAFEAHERQEGESSRQSGDAAEILGDDLEKALEAELGSRDRAREVLAYVQQRAGLLVAEDGGTYRFPHRTFQEYLAARHVLSRADCASDLRARLERDLAWWREVFLLACGSVRETTPWMVLNLVNELVPRGPSRKGVKALELALARLSAQALEETGQSEGRRGQPSVNRRLGAMQDRLQRWLLRGLKARHLPAVERARSGASLAVVGDPRAEVIRLDKMEFCRVPGGDFWMGEAESGDFEAHPNTHLSKPYWLGRFPVTVAQFREYVERSGAEIEDGDVLLAQANAPVARVSWYECVTFCAWLTADWRARGLLPEGWEVRLPTEAEWEKGARGGLEVPKCAVVKLIQAGLAGQLSVPIELEENPARRRSYPWPDDFDPRLCNSLESEIGHSSTVGCFAKGRSPYGCEELSGNVWEWTSSRWGKNWEEPDYLYPYDPCDGREDSEQENDESSGLWVLRGGSFDYDQYYVRCSVRYWPVPTYRLDLIGFRVVVSPSAL